MLELLATLVISVLAVFFGFYLFYYCLCWSYINFRRPKYTAVTTNFQPSLSIIIPVYNEIKVLDRKITNLKELNYPRKKLEIIFVDGGSTDGSARFLEEIANDCDLEIKSIFQGKRRGFNNAVIEGFGLATGDFILISGAEVEFEKDSLNMLMRHFSNPKIGAVTGRQRIKNQNAAYSPKLEVAYRDLYDFLREAESFIDSPFDLKGEISVAKREIIKALVENPKLSRKGCIDVCSVFQGRMDNLKTVYEPNAIYYELSPTMMRDSFKQLYRRAATLIENMLVFKSMIFNRRYGAFGMIIMPAHLMMLIPLPFFLLLGSIGTITLAILNPSNYLFIIIISAALLSLVLSKRIQAFIKTQIALMIALLKIMRGVETQKFEKLESVRPNVQSD